jgi:hypothetical protein
MKKIKFALSTILPAITLTAALCLASQSLYAQSAPDPSCNTTTRNTTTQEQPLQPDDQNAASLKTFNGKIVKSGDKLVLMDVSNKTTYQLDDQERAQDFLNKSVRVTGVLDASTGTIRVSAIELV